MSRRGFSQLLTAIAGAGTAVAIGYFFVGRPWHLRWGASDNEAEGPFPGDDFIPGAKVQSTRAITIHARPEEVWPWLVQVGYHRAGWYSYDQLEKLAGAGDFAEGRSAMRILPQFQHLEAGGKIPLAPGSDYTVVNLEPNHLLAMRARIFIHNGQTVDFADPDFGDAFDTSWVFQLTPLANDRTRLAVRFRANFAPTPVNRAFAYGALEPAVFIMEQTMLRGIRDRAEISAAI